MPPIGLRATLKLSAQEHSVRVADDPGAIDKRYAVSFPIGACVRTMFVFHNLCGTDCATPTESLGSAKLRILGMGRKAQKNDSLPGSLDILILRTLSRRDLHGYGIVQFIQQSSDDELLVEEGSLYPALQRLELNGWIEGAWGLTPNNRKARIYKITAAGRKQLGLETRKYAKLTLAIARVMGTE